MKRIPRILLTIAIALILPTTAISDDKTITISTGEWPPFISESFKHHGIATRIISESFALQDIKVEYSWFPWKRTYNNVKTGDWDASAIWAITPEREKDVLFSDPIIRNTTVLFFNKDKYRDWNSFEDLSGLVIGATNGYFYGKAFKKAEEQGLIIVERTNTESHNFKKLAANRLDAVAAEVDTGYYIMRGMFDNKEISSVQVNNKAIASFNNHLVISKKLDNAAELITTFNQGLKKLNESGKVNQYLQESREGKYQ